MPTILSHAAVPVSLALASGLIPRRLLFVGIIACIIPDIDVLAFRFNIAYAHDFGHRGFTHSVMFAFALALLALAFARQLQASRKIAFAFIGLSTVSHPLLDMLTNGTHGVALLWPWSNERYVAGWHVIEASPLSLRRVFSERGLVVLQSELLWIWLPAVVFAVVVFFIRKRMTRRAE